MPWSPVFLGLGVALYFALGREPAPAVYAVLVALLPALAGFGRYRRENFGPAATALCLVIAGLVLAGWRAHSVAGPVLGFRYYGAIEGRVVAVDRSASDAVRLTLDQVVLERIDPDRVPDRVRVSLHGEQRWLSPEPGARVMMTGYLAPPEGPAEPGGFDFQRHAWFLGIGAVGYTRTPALTLAPRADGAAWLTHLRLRLSAEIQARIPGEEGAFAAAVLTGDRSGLSAGAVEDMRRSNIAHLLAISGLHMGLLTGFVFAAVRFGMALWPAVALRFPVRKWAAVAALSTGAFYLALSGGNVATERAFIQVAVMFAAVLLDRRAITLRAVAIAALIVLARRPETLLSPGFQMSFAATAALVAAFNGLRGAAILSDRPAWQRAMLALVLSSAVAGAATAPFAAAQFNQIAVYGLAANLLSVPVMGSLVIPSAVLAALSWPVGLDWLPLAVMQAGLGWILGVAERVSDLPGAVRMVASPPGWVLPVLSLGALWLIIWRGRARLAGAAVMALALAGWPLAERPDLLVSPSGRLAGALTADGRALSRPRGDGFVAGIWLENDGDRGTRAMASERPAWAEDGRGRSLTLGGVSVWHGAGRRALAEARAACAAHDLVILSEPVAGEVPELAARARASWPFLFGDSGRAAPEILLASAAEAAPTPGVECLLVSAETLRETGALAITLRDGRPRAVSARSEQGARLWSSASVRAARSRRAGLPQ